MIEIFKDIPWYEWIYQVSNLWNIISLWNEFSRKEKRLKFDYTKHWYCKVQLNQYWIRKKFLVHRLVMLTFVWPSTLEVNHINHITDDNRLDNLEYVTSSENKSKRRPFPRKRKYIEICCPHCSKTFETLKYPKP